MRGWLGWGWRARCSLAPQHLPPPGLSGALSAGLYSSPHTFPRLLCPHGQASRALSAGFTHRRPSCCLRADVSGPLSVPTSDFPAGLQTRYAPFGYFPQADASAGPFPHLAPHPPSAAKYNEPCLHGGSRRLPLSFLSRGPRPLASPARPAAQRLLQLLLPLPPALCPRS